MPRVSVIVPAYNAAQSIAAAIASAQRQDEPNLEILVIDDGSTDATAAVVRELARADPRIVTISAETNDGPGAARNRGIERASGTWVAPLDADDTFRPDRLATLVGRGDATGADLVGDDLLIVAADGAPRTTLLRGDAGAATEFWLGAAEFVEGNIGRGEREPRTLGFLKPVLRADFLRSHALRYPAARFAEDYLFYLDCLLCGGRWLMLRRAMYEYRQRPGSLTHALGEADLMFLYAAERARLIHPTVACDRRLQNAIRDHSHSVKLAAGWRGFVDAAKAGRWTAACSGLLRNPQSLPYVGRQSLRALPRLPEIVRRSRA